MSGNEENSWMRNNLCWFLGVNLMKEKCLMDDQSVCELSSASKPLKNSAIESKPIINEIYNKFIFDWIGNYNENKILVSCAGFLKIYSHFPEWIEILC